MKRALAMALSLLGAAVLAAGGFYAGRHTTAENSMTAMPAPAAPGAAERRVLYWHDPMVPGQRFDKPGKSPFMDMQLVPVYADEAGDAGVKISPTVQQNLGIRTVVVGRADVSSSFDAIGAVQFDERLGVAVQTRVAGYVEQLAVRAPMERVRKGQPLASLFAPDWLGPQNELLALQRAGASQELIAAARERLRALSIPEALIRQSEATGTAQARFTLSAPVSGVIAELGVREGVAVTPGTTLFRIAGLERVWAVAEVPEAQAARLERGQKVWAALQADTSQTFEGQLTEILPQVSASTRTLQARFEVDNAGGKLVPGMLLRMQMAGPSASRLVVPAEAVIRTGTRAVTIVRKDSGEFAARDIQLGADLGDTIEVLSGLAEGEQVVASGQFLIDSEARLRSVLGAMAAGTAAPVSAPASAPAAMHVGDGKVESIEADSILISHGPIASLKWPAMTMGFGKPAGAAFAGIGPGDTVRFEFRQGGTMGYELVSVQRLGAAK
ncbi:efflux RND transporter periplasmic adaptor subunit [Pseudorhodoferax soli]|uniref:Cu(I)/Ag(I) efflux system membrane fusion protein n=1 Tax=Pseudorhodoferax soli TaxID=545864 RepID=A0A368XDL6_9BURK|nr:efflux RND transporter periplasmic adaptor subunit [Pseudorhodoferax soli]RCW66072.1 Cu(I)/Ag(I) efflux system membrane fusion protein [Pseudorhodoferax soli]